MPLRQLPGCKSFSGRHLLIGTVEDGSGTGFGECVDEDQEVGVRRDGTHLAEHGCDLAPMERGMHDEVLHHVAKRLRPGLPLRVHVGDYLVGRGRREIRKEGQLIGVDGLQGLQQRIRREERLRIQSGRK